MFEGELGVKADGLSVQQFLMHGIPCSQSAEAIIADIDEQLMENGAQIEECIKSLLEMTTELTGEHSFLHPVDAINHMADNQLLEKMACYNPEPEQIHKLLKHVMTLLDENPGSEESILQHLLQLTSKEGMWLPRCTATGSGTATASSTLSINTATDDAEQANLNLWHDICMRLRKHFIDKLSQLPMRREVGEGEEGRRIRALGDERLRYLHSLCALFPADSVWQRYKALRIHQLDTRLLSSKSPGSSSGGSGGNGQGGKDVSFLRIVSHMAEELLPTLETMISEDYEVINSGVLVGGGGSGLAALQEMYSERLIEEVTAAVSTLQQEMNDTAAGKHRPSASNSKQEIAKSSSEFGFMNQLKGRRQQSKSLDSLMKADDMFTDLNAMPMRHVDSIVMYVELLIKLEKFLSEIFSALIWEARPKRVKSLKSALKGSHQDFREKKGVFSPRSFEQSGLLPEAIPPPFGATPAMMSHSSSSTIALERQASLLAHWDWRPAFRSAASQLSSLLDTHLRSPASDLLMPLLDNALDTGHLPEPVPLPRHMAGGSMDNPQAATKEVVVLASELERALPLIQIAGCVKVAYIDTTTFILKTVHTKLNKLCREVNDKFPISTHYTVLSNVVLLKNVIHTLQEVLTDPNPAPSEADRDKPLWGVEKQYSDLEELCTGRITGYHRQIMVSQVLHDAESNHWSDNKEFFENDRCSMSISAWHLHVWQLREDLWRVCPPRVAQNLLLTVLHDSLTTLCHRYVRIKPSYRRTQQYKQDMVTVLVCVCEVLWSCSSHSGHYLCPSTSHRQLFAIHNCCGSLLAAMAIVCSPIDTLYRVFKKGFEKKALRREDEELRGYMCQWLSWLYPAFLEPGHHSLTAVNTTTALYVQLRLLHAQPPAAVARTSSLLMQALLMKQCRLSTMLLSQVCQQPQAPGAGDVVTALTGILLHCGGAGYPGALTLSLLPALDVPANGGEAKKGGEAKEGEQKGEGTGWDVLTTTNPDQQLPIWLTAILHHLDSFLLRCVEPGIRVLLARNIAPPPVPSLLEWMEQLPCGCTPHKDSTTKAEEALGSAGGVGGGTSGDEELLRFSFEPADLQQQQGSGGGSSKDILAEALYSVISQLTEDMYVLATPLLSLLQAIQRAAESKELTTPHECAAIKVFALGMRNILMDVERVQNLVDQKLNNDLLDYIRMLAECVYHVLTATSYSKSSGIPRIASQFMKANRNWLREQIDTIAEHMNNTLFETEDSPDLLEDASPEFLEQQLLVLTDAVLTAPKGATWLRCVSHLVENNLSWLLAQLSVPPLLPLCHAPAPAFVLDLHAPAPPAPSPLNLHNTIAGFYKFDHAKIAELPWNWAALLQSDLGVTEVGFRSLLFQRHEMQDGAYLEETEMKPVQTLRNKFD